MPYFPDFPSYSDYFNSYTLRDEYFRDFKFPVKIFIADDDPVIPQGDFHAISEHDNFQIFRMQFGGHCGFVDFFPHYCWYNKIIGEFIGRSNLAGGPVRR
jgi:uncharacterized protein